MDVRSGHPAEAVPGWDTVNTRLLADVERRSTTLLAALAAAIVAAGLHAAGASVPVVADAAPGFRSGPLLIVLALLPAAVSGALLLSGRHNAAAGVLVGAAALAPGRAVLDLQLAADPGAALRPELYLPGDLLRHPPGAGLWLLVAGHGALAVAGLLAVRAARERADVADAGERATDGHDVATWRQRWLFVVMVAAVVAASGLLMAPFASGDVYLLARNAFEGPAVALTGYLLVAAALPLAAALFMTSGNGPFARGGLGGLAIGVACVAVPSVAAAASIDATSVSSGPVVALVAVAVLLAVAFVRASARAERDDSPDRSGEVAVPGQRRLLTATGVLAVLTALAAAAGSLTAQLSSPGPAPAPESPARWLLLAAGVLVGALGLGLFVPRVAIVLRPALTVAWVGVLLAGTAVLDTAITATGVPGGSLSSGPGVLWTWLAMCGAAATACCSVIAGMVEREDADGLDPADGTGAGMNLLTPVTAAAVLAVAALGTPVVTAADYIAAGLWSDFGTPSWGLLAAALTVLGATVLAPRSRPRQAAALLAGAAGVLAVHASALPLTGSHLPDARAGIGLWLSLAAIAALLVAAAIALAGRRGTGE